MATQRFLEFSPRNLGKWSNLRNLFERGWNHQPVIFMVLRSKGRWWNFKYVFMFTPILWKMKPFWLPHIFQVGCSCSYRTLSSWLTGNDLEPGYSKRKKPPYEILRSGDEMRNEISKDYGKESAKCFFTNLRHPEIQNSFLERNNVEKSGSWGSIVTYTGGTFDLQNGMTWDDYYDSYSESVARHSTSWEGFWF